MWYSLALLTLALSLGANAAATLGNATRAGIGARDVQVSQWEYHFDPTARTWLEALVYCNSINAYIAAVNSEAERQVIHDIMRGNGASTVNSGFHDSFIEGEYVTVTGDAVESMNYGVDSNWAIGYPNGGSKNNCGGLNSEGRFIDINCGLRYQTICEYHPTASYDWLPGYGYYSYHRELRTWPQAWQICRSEGAYLHILNSAAEKTALFQKYGFTYVWTGVQRLISGSDRQFYTLFNEPIERSGYQTWAQGHPTGTCAQRPYVASVTNVNLITAVPTQAYSFICEIDH